MADAKEKCTMCSDPTNYCCISCQGPVCNICSIFEENEQNPGWKAGKSVARCLKCKKCEGLNERTTNSNQDFVQSITKLKETLHSPSDSSDEGTKVRRISGNSSSDSDESMTAFNLGKRGKKQAATKKKKPGRKSHWSSQVTDDLIDIIVNNDKFKSKLIFQNTKNQQNGKLYENILQELKKRSADRGEEITFSSPLLRTKFKKCVGECKKAALTMKTATCIKRFQDSKNYGFWFNQLFAIVKTRDSCQPEHALEPSVMATHRIDENCENSRKNDKSQEKLFVPVKGRRKNRKPDNSTEALKLLKQVVESDTTQNVIDSMREEMKKSREHELKLFQMMCQTFTPRPQQPNQDYARQSTTQNVPSLPLQFSQAQQQPSTAFVNQGFQSNLHVLQPVFQPSGFHPFSESLPLSGEHSSFDHNASKSSGYC